MTSANPSSVLASTSSQASGKNRAITELEKKFSVLNICDVMDWIYSTYAPGKEIWEMSYDWETARIADFCKTFDVYLYERPRSSFFKWEGIEEATQGGYKGVILSDLS